MLEKYWTAFYTKPRNEKKVAERLAAQGYEIYAPMRTTVKQWSDRKKKVQVPLFSSYIFARISENERLDLLKDTGIVRSVFWLQHPVRIPQTEIEAIKAFLNKHPQVVAHAFEPAQSVKVQEGALKGFSGYIEEVRKREVLLNLSHLGFALKATLNHEVLINFNNT